MCSFLLNNDPCQGRWWPSPVGSKDSIWNLNLNHNLRWTNNLQWVFLKYYFTIFHSYGLKWGTIFKNEQQIKKMKQKNAIKQNYPPEKISKNNKMSKISIILSMVHITTRPRNNWSRANPMRRDTHIIHGCHLCRARILQVEKDANKQRHWQHQQLTK